MTQARQKRLTRTERLAQARQFDAKLVRFLQNDFQKRRRPDVAIGLQIRHRLNLLLSLADAAGKHRAAERVRAGFHHRARWREVIGEAIVDEIAATKSRGVQRTREPPVIGRAAFGLANRTGRCEDTARIAPTRRGESAERTIRFLQLEQLGLARDGNACERLVSCDRGGINVRQNARERRRMRLRVRDLARKLPQLLALARRRVTCLEPVEVIAHRPDRSETLPRDASASVARVFLGSLATTSACECAINARASESLNAFAS